MQTLFIILFVLFFFGLVGFVYFCIKGTNLIIGFVTTSLYWTIIAIVYQIALGVHLNNINGFASGWNTVIGVFDNHFQSAISSYGGVAATMIIAAWFGRIIVDTGITKAIIRKVAELSGDKQMLTVMLIAVVNSLIFTSVFGPGAVIAMGVIILPIFFSMGVNKIIAIGALIMSVAAGMFVNPGLTVQFTGNDLFTSLFPDSVLHGEFLLFGWVAFAINVTVMCLFIFVSMHFSKNKLSAWSMTDDIAGEEQDLSIFAYFVPFFPALFTLLMTFINLLISSDATGLNNFGPLTLFALGIILALLVTKSFTSLTKATNVVQKTLFNALSDIALLLGMLLALQIFIASSNGTVRPLFAHVVGDALNWIVDIRFVVAIIFIIIAPLGLFRGPLTFFGAGAAFAGILAAVFPETELAFVFLLFFVPSIAINVQLCPTQSWVLWTVQYSKEDPGILIRNYLVWGWMVMALVTLAGYLIIVL